MHPHYDNIAKNTIIVNNNSTTLSQKAHQMQPINLIIPWQWFDRSNNKNITDNIGKYLDDTEANKFKRDQHTPQNYGMKQRMKTLKKDVSWRNTLAFIYNIHKQLSSTRGGGVVGRGFQFGKHSYHKIICILSLLQFTNFRNWANSPPYGLQCRLHNSPFSIKLLISLDHCSKNVSSTAVELELFMNFIWWQLLPKSQYLISLSQKLPPLSRTI